MPATKRTPQTKRGIEAPLPTQLCVWHEEYVGSDGDTWGQYLYALKATQPGDRQLVWEGGGSERGIIGVVDFGSTAVPANGRYYAFGNATWLKEPITHQKLARVPTLRERFLGTGRTFLQGGPKRLSPDVGAALTKLAGGWPPQKLPTGDRLNEPFERWQGLIDIDPEKVFELAILADRRLRKQIGFSDAVKAQVRISNRSRPDLLDRDQHVVGEVKRLIRANDLRQVERYLEDLADPQWRAVLIHNDELSDRVAEALDNSSESDRIAVWRLDEQRNGRFKAVAERKVAPPAKRRGRR
jgi:hypothetical protein